MEEKWEYARLILGWEPKRGSDEMDALNEMGEQGWEAFFITTNNVVFLKRLKENKNNNKAASKTGSAKK